MATTGSVRGYILFQVIVTVVQIPVVVAARLLLMLLYEINVHIFTVVVFQLHQMLYLSCWKSRNSLKYNNQAAQTGKDAVK